MRTGCLIVISGPSGAGKGTVCSEFLRACPEVAYSISATTRAPREGEQEQCADAASEAQDCHGGELCQRAPGRIEKGRRNEG